MRIHIYIHKRTRVNATWFVYERERKRERESELQRYMQHLRERGGGEEGARQMRRACASIRFRLPLFISGLSIESDRALCRWSDAFCFLGFLLFSQKFFSPLLALASGGKKDLSKRVAKLSTGIRFKQT